MKAILLRRPGDPSALEYVEVPTPQPGEGEVLVKANTIGVSMPEVTGAQVRLRMDAAAAGDPGDRTHRNNRRAGAGYYRTGCRATRLRQRPRSARACWMLCRTHCRAGACNASTSAGLFA
jgi:hypothetical protein